MKRIFFNREERRVRALWRLVLHTAVMFLMILVVAGVVESFLGPEIFEIDGLLSTRLLGVGLELLVIGGAVIVCGRWLDRRRLRDFGFRFGRAWCVDFAFGLALGFGLIAAIFLAEYASGWIDVTGFAVGRPDGGPFALQLFGMLVLFLCAALTEELLSRGYHLKNVAEGLNGIGPIGPRVAIVVAVLLSSAVFSAFHATNPHATFWSGASLVLAGVALATGYLLTGELAIPLGFHLAWNFAEGNVFGFPVSGFDAGPTLIDIEQRGPEWLTGGAFGPEAGALAVLAEIAAIVLIVRWVRRRRGRAGLHLALAEPELRDRA